MPSAHLGSIFWIFSAASRFGAQHFLPSCTLPMSPHIFICINLIYRYILNFGNRSSTGKQGLALMRTACGIMQKRRLLISTFAVWRLFVWFQVLDVVFRWRGFLSVACIFQVRQASATGRCANVLSNAMASWPAIFIYCPWIAPIENLIRWSLLFISIPNYIPTRNADGIRCILPRSQNNISFVWQTRHFSRLIIYKGRNWRYLP